jgi:hypothetical protein
MPIAAVNDMVVSSYEDLISTTVFLRPGIQHANLIATGNYKRAALHVSLKQLLAGSNTTPSLTVLLAGSNDLGNWYKVLPTDPMIPSELNLTATGPAKLEDLVLGGWAWVRVEFALRAQAYGSGSAPTPSRALITATVSIV